MRIISNTGLAFVVAVIIGACGNNSATPEPRSVALENIKPNEQGKMLFYSKCASCHMVNKEMTGPALKNVEQRWPDKKKLYAFIRNSDSVVQTDAYAKELWLEWNQTAMTPHPDLTDTDINAILSYIKAVTE